MTKLNVWDWIALILVIIGGLNWGLVGIFGLDVVSWIFGNMAVISRIIFILVGLSALYIAVMLPKFSKS